jgi:hypothetical protein
MTAAGATVSWGYFIVAKERSTQERAQRVSHTPPIATAQFKFMAATYAG